MLMKWISNRDFRGSARAWLEKIHLQYEKDIRHSIENTDIIYPSNSSAMELEENSVVVNPNITLIDADTTTAIFKYYSEDKKIAVLNFANYMEPGGGFLRGAMAQEECLCHESTLYPVLSAFEEKYYRRHSEKMDDFLYDDEILFSKDILFIRDDKEVFADVISSAAPCIIEDLKYRDSYYEEYCLLMRKRVDAILVAANRNRDVDVLILGAFGCGAFGNDPRDVARIFMEAISDLREKNTIKEIVFAIPKVSNNINYSVFKEIISETISN